ncbi:MAG TPA: TlpA disulfide reductase family protein [Pseudosphingobacterium sp.]|nr:TlpA disulfide reductase family protein [Pseudosphingobacterium sp.]
MNDIIVRGAVCSFRKKKILSTTRKPSLTMSNERLVMNALVSFAHKFSVLFCNRIRMTCEVKPVSRTRFIQKINEKSTYNSRLTGKRALNSNVGFLNLADAGRFLDKLSMTVGVGLISGMTDLIQKINEKTTCNSRVTVKQDLNGFYGYLVNFKCSEVARSIWRKANKKICKWRVTCCNWLAQTCNSRLTGKRTLNGNVGFLSLADARRFLDKLSMMVRAGLIIGGISPVQKNIDKTTCNSPLTGKRGLRGFRDTFWCFFTAKNCIKKWRKFAYRFLRKVEMTPRHKVEMARGKSLASYVLYLATIKILFCVCLAHARQQGLCTPVATGVALSTDSIKPLQIGDNIPSTLWNVPLQMIKAGQEGTTTATLNDYRGKLIILDFWATWCKSCLLTMPKMHNLQKRFSQDVSLIPSTYEPPDKIIPFLKIPADSSLAAVKKNFHGIVNGSMLNKFFPHRSLPYLVVINKQGIVAALTEPLSVDENTLSEFLTDSTKTLYPKKEKLEKPLLGNQMIESTKPLYYSMFTGFLEKYMFPTGTEVDSSAGTKWHYYINKPILQLYALAYKSALPRTPNKRILLVENPQKFEYSYQRSNSFSTRTQSYSYEAVLPLSMDEEAIKMKMVDDLNYHLGLHAKTIKVKMDCLVLKSYEPKTETKSVGAFTLVVKGKKRKPIDDKVHDEPNHSTYFKNAPVRILGGLIEAIYPQINEGYILPTVINELPKKGNVNLYFSQAIHSINDLIAVLKSQGVEACLENREMEFFILSEQPIGDKLPELKLTPIGYVAKN